MLRSEAGNVNLTKGGWVRRRRASYPGQQTPGVQYTQRTFTHPDYDEVTLANNVGLISLAQPFDVQKAEGKINSICVPQSLKEDHSGEQHYVSGWGAIDGVIEFKPKLQIVKAQVVDCEPTAPVVANQICVVQDLDDSVEDCVGDFGGPLFATNGNTSTLIGLYSSGNGCSVDNTAKFIDIKPYMVWIIENSKPA
ncbi:unnamed protein product, partial [Oppiella nova]